MPQQSIQSVKPYMRSHLDVVTIGLENGVAEMNGRTTSPHPTASESNYTLPEVLA